MPETLPPTPGPDAPGEPLLSVGGIVTAVTALIGLGVAFGLPVDDDQQAAILAVVAVLAPAAVALIGRGRVYAPLTVRKMVRRAAAKPEPPLPDTGTTVVRDL